MIPASRKPARKPPLPLLILLIASLSMSVLTAGHARDYTRSWDRVRRGKNNVEQRLTLGRRVGWPTAIVPWFDRSFLVFAENLKATIPADASILIEPESGEIYDESGRARWFMYLNYVVYPLKCYVKQPKKAGGTLPDYALWLVHHRKKPNAHRALNENLAIADRGIDWKLTFAVTRDFARDSAKLFRRAGGGWEPVPVLTTEERRARKSEGEDSP